MFDFHNHFTDDNAFKYTAELLPENISSEYDIKLTGISEIGLDKRYSSIISMGKQVNLLTDMLIYAKENNIGVSLHCVQETELMIDILQKAKLKPYKTVWHSFNGSKETASKLLSLGVIISISPKFKGNLNELYAANPLLVLETDYTGNNPDEYEAILRNHYNRCAEELSIPLAALEMHCNELKQAFEA